MNNYTAKIDKRSSERILSILKQKGFQNDGVKSEYEVYRLRGDNVTAIYYSSGKLLFQGRGTEALKNELFGEENNTYDPVIGSDEVGKGDYFGPMVVVSCYADVPTQRFLKEKKVADSKRLSDDKIVEIAEEISSKVLYEVEIIMPAQYDEQIRKYKNVAIVLSKAHSKVLDRLFNRVRKQRLPVKKIVVDQFSKSKRRLLDELDSTEISIEIEQMHHGESKNIVVAAASILARWIFLDEWEKMQKKYNFVFPKGASDVIGQGRIFVDEFGLKELDNVAKVSFKTTASILENELL